MSGVVIGFGNSLHGDDGFGPAVLAALGQDPGLPPGTELCLVQDPLAALGLVRTGHLVVMVDALEPSGEPGRVLVLDPLEDQGNDSGAHGCTPGFVARAVYALEPTPPRMILVGAEAECLDSWSEGLSVRLAMAVPIAVERVLNLLAEYADAQG